MSYPEFIPNSGACLVSKNLLEGSGTVRWMMREESDLPADNGWRLFSDIDTPEYLADPENLLVVAYNHACAIEPALIGIYDFPYGTELQIVRNDAGIHILETHTGREIPHEELFVPPEFRA